MTVQGQKNVMDRQISKVVILTTYPFNQRDHDRFGVETLRDNGFAVEIWDISSWLLNRNKGEIPEDEITSFQGHRRFKEKKDLVKAISSLDNRCLVNCIIEYSVRTFFIFKALSKKGINYSVFGMISFPSPYTRVTSRTQWAWGVLKRANSLKFSEIIQHFCNKILVKFFYLFGIRPAAIILRGGEKSTGNSSYPIDDSTKELWTHMLDFDIFLKNSARATSAENFGVFLDDYLPLHPDHIYSGIEYALSPDNYYKKISSFFLVLEKDLKCQIQIAAHPRSEYERLPDYFQGMTVIKGETPRLVRESAFVIAHMSTAINFAVLYKKPILFITTDELETLTSGKDITGLYIRAIAAELGKKPINIDHIQGINWEKELNIDAGAYRRYKEQYIKRPDTPEKPLWEIFSHYVKEM